jgi:predicted MPP superfamily phosphohydrolase
MEYNTQKLSFICRNTAELYNSWLSAAKNFLPKRRNEMAMAIIDFMGQRNPQLRDEENYKHKLWDHLYILANHDWM